MLFIKFWARFHDINDAHKRTISSYSLALMLIHYLQGEALSVCLSAHPPIHLPVRPSVCLCTPWLSCLFTTCRVRPLSVCPSTHPSACPSICLSLYSLAVMLVHYLQGEAFICRPVHPSICLSIHLSVLPGHHASSLSAGWSLYLSICPSICLSACLSICLCTPLPSCLSITCRVRPSLSVCLSVFVLPGPHAYSLPAGWDFVRLSVSLCTLNFTCLSATYLQGEALSVLACMSCLYISICLVFMFCLYIFSIFLALIFTTCRVRLCMHMCTSHLSACLSCL